MRVLSATLDGEQFPRSTEAGMPVWRRMLRKVLDLGLLATLICVLVPLRPLFPEGLLDPSWAMSTNQAVAQGLHFGHDIAFTFGPYAAVFSWMYHPATDALALGASGILAVCYWLACRSLFSRGGAAVPAVLIVVLAVFTHSRDGVLLSYPLLVGLLWTQLLSVAGVSGRQVAFLTLLAIPFGLLPLVKGSLLILCGAIGLVLVSALALRKRYGSIVSIVGASAASLVLFWLAAGQPLSGLPGWLSSLAPIIGGYTDAMSIDGPAGEIGAYLVGAGGLLAMAAIVPSGSVFERRYTIAILGAYLFLVFKAGFVRHDLHAMIAGTGLLLASIFALPRFPRRDGWLLLILSACICVLINQHYVSGGVRALVGQGAGTYFNGWSGAVLRASGSRPLDGMYRGRLEDLRGAVSMPKLPGAMDIYSYHQAYLLASGNRWRPRPVLQSYFAYTQELADRNNEHLLGPNAPDFLAFRVETIDGRIPSGDDGASWPTILSRYTPVARDSGFVYLRRMKDTNSIRVERLSGEFRSFYERVELQPERAPVMYARIHVRKTFAGKLASFFYKPRPVFMRVDLVDGSQRVLRLVPGMAEGGFVVSPLIESNDDFLKLFQNQDGLPGKRVNALTLASDGGEWQWHSHYEIEIIRLGTATGGFAP